MSGLARPGAGAAGRAAARAILALRALLALLTLAPWPAAAVGPAVLDFSAAERAQIAQHGPWPPPPATDPGNALAGRPAAIVLGQRLFLAPQLSPDGRMACASCHVPGLAFTDGLPRGQGRSRLARNTPSLWNAGQARWYGWDGAFDSLWSQALHPLRHPQEMASTAAHLRNLLQRDAALGCAWRAAIGPLPALHGERSPRAGAAAVTDADADADARINDDDSALLVPLAKALGAFVGNLRSGRTPFDDFRDALLQGDQAAAARYPLAAQRGLRLFIGRARCQLCHSGPLFSNREFGDIGLPFFVRPGEVDPGRHGGIVALQASRFNLLGRFADGPAAGSPGAQPLPDDPARKTRHLLAQERNFGEFKVPSLRNVALTAPYMHDGQLATLGDVVQHYDQINLERLHADGAQLLQPLGLDGGERADLVAFLQSLSDPQARAWQPQPGDQAHRQQGWANPCGVPARSDKTR